MLLGEGLYKGSACVKLKVREVSGSGFIRGIAGLLGFKIWTGL